jgi:fibrillarin-like rRNA methylase
MTHILAPVFTTVDEAFFIMPANIEVIWVIKNTENVIPMSNDANFPQSFTRSL